VSVAATRFEDLVADHGASLLRVAYLLCRDGPRSEDLVQETLIKALRQDRAGRWPDQPGPYLRKVLLNEYLGWRRGRSSREIIGLPHRDAGLPDRTERLADRAAMWELLGTLTPRARAVLVLRYYEDLPDAEIARILGCAQPTVRTIAARAIAALREQPGLGAFAARQTLETDV
jgi:RNA polymerase sigma-70 factor (sigma-E family)